MYSEQTEANPAANSWDMAAARFGPLCIFGHLYWQKSKPVDIILNNTGKEVTNMCSTCKTHNPGRTAAKPAAKPAKKKAPARKK